MYIDVVGLVHQRGSKIIDCVRIILRQKFLFARMSQSGNHLSHSRLGGPAGILQGHIGRIQLCCRLQDAQCLIEIAIFKPGFRLLSQLMDLFLKSNCHYLHSLQQLGVIRRQLQGSLEVHLCFCVLL